MRDSTGIDEFQSLIWSMEDETRAGEWHTPDNDMLEAVGDALVKLPDDEQKSQAIDMLINSASEIRELRRGPWCLKVLDLMNDTAVETPRPFSVSPRGAGVEEADGEIYLMHAAGDRDASFLNLERRELSSYEDKSLALRTAISGSDGANLARFYQLLFPQQAEHYPNQDIEPVSIECGLQQLTSLRKEATAIPGGDDFPEVADAIKFVARGVIAKADARMNGTEGLGLLQLVDRMRPHHIAGLLTGIATLSVRGAAFRNGVVDLCKVTADNFAQDEPRREILYGLLLKGVLIQAANLESCHTVIDLLNHDYARAGGRAVDNFVITKEDAEKIRYLNKLALRDSVVRFVDSEQLQAQRGQEARLARVNELMAMQPVVAVVSGPMMVARYARSSGLREHLEAALWACISVHPEISQGYFSADDQAQLSRIAIRLAKTNAVKALSALDILIEAKAIDPRALLKSIEEAVDEAEALCNADSVQLELTKVAVKLLRDCPNAAAALRLIQTLFGADEQTRTRWEFASDSLVYMMCTRDRQAQEPHVLSPHLLTIDTLRNEARVYGDPKVRELLRAIIGPLILPLDRRERTPDAPPQNQAIDR